MELFLDIIKNHQKVMVLLISVIMAISFITTIYELGTIFREYVWRLFAYLSFSVIFIILLIFKEKWLYHEKRQPKTTKR